MLPVMSGVLEQAHTLQQTGRHGQTDSGAMFEPVGLLIETHEQEEDKNLPGHQTCQPEKSHQCSGHDEDIPVAEKPVNAVYGRGVFMMVIVWADEKRPPERCVDIANRVFGPMEKAADKVGGQT
ncbi:MAG: hypothetical protein NTX73_09330 [Rhodobacterales bacterium]|nr:hypothetical protein [Rhodobacterales bacterium]